MDSITFNPTCHAPGFVPPKNRPYRGWRILRNYAIWGVIFVPGMIWTGILGGDLWIVFGVLACFGLPFIHIPYCMASWDGVGAAEVFAAEGRRVSALSDRELLEEIRCQPHCGCGDGFDS